MYPRYDVHVGFLPERISRVVIGGVSFRDQTDVLLFVVALFSRLPGRESSRRRQLQHTLREEEEQYVSRTISLFITVTLYPVLASIRSTIYGGVRRLLFEEALSVPYSSYCGRTIIARSPDHWTRAQQPRYSRHDHKITRGYYTRRLSIE